MRSDRVARQARRGRTSPPAGPRGGTLSVLPARLGRALLLPGPLPPHSHLGVTLLRHVVGTGLRSALHRLGMPLLPVVPVRIVSLRLYLDRPALERQLGAEAGGNEAVGAVIEPGGAAEPGSGSARLRGAALLHRLRLRRPATLRRPPEAAGGRPAEEFRRALSALLPALSDAILAELVAALDRRRNRAAGEPCPPCLGTQASRFLAGRPVALDHLGPPEPLLASWAGAAPPRPAAGEPPPESRLRGRFREQYRAALDLLAPLYRRLAERAVARGLLDDPSDAFFIPLDLIDDLDADRRPDWLAGAVSTNRHEYMTQRTSGCPPDRVDPDSGPSDPPAAWDLCPLNPLL